MLRQLWTDPDIEYKGTWGTLESDVTKMAQETPAYASTQRSAIRNLWTKQTWKISRVHLRKWNSKIVEQKNLRKKSTQKGKEDNSIYFALLHPSPAAPKLALLSTGKEHLN